MKRVNPSPMKERKRCLVLKRNTERAAKSADPDDEEEDFEDIPIEELIWLTKNSKRCNADALQR